MKRFLMFSVALLCFSTSALVWLHVGSGAVSAQSPGDIAFARGRDVLLNNGEYWRIDEFQCWRRGDTKYDSPVSVSEIAFYYWNTLTTRDGHFWQYNFSAGEGFPEGWQDCGTVPFPVPTSPASLSEIKQRYRGIDKEQD